MHCFLFPFTYLPQAWALSNLSRGKTPSSVFAVGDISSRFMHLLVALLGVMNRPDRDITAPCSAAEVPQLLLAFYTYFSFLSSLSSLTLSHTYTCICITHMYQEICLELVHELAWSFTFLTNFSVKDPTEIGLMLQQGLHHM